MNEEIRAARVGATERWRQTRRLRSSQSAGPRGIDTRQLLRARAERLRRLGYAFLVGIILLLGLGSILFVNASLLSVWDASQVSNEVEEATATLRDAYRNAALEAFAKARVRFDVPTYVEDPLLAKISQVTPAVLTTGLASIIADVFSGQGVPAEGKSATAEGPPPTRPLSQVDLLAMLPARLETIAEIVAAKRTICTFARQQDEGATATDASSLLISTQITRFGAVAMIIFLVTIFVSLYRYSVRLSAFYDARADALLLLNVTGENALDTPELRAAVEILSPDAYDFGKMPQSMIERALDVAMQTSAEVARKVRG